MLWRNAFFLSGRWLGVPRGCPFGKAVLWAVEWLEPGHGPGYSCPAQPVLRWFMSFISIPKASRAGMSRCCRRRHWPCSQGAGFFLPSQGQPKPCPGIALTGQWELSFLQNPLGFCRTKGSISKEILSGEGDGLTVHVGSQYWQEPLPTWSLLFHIIAVLKSAKVLIWNNPVLLLYCINVACYLSARCGSLKLQVIVLESFCFQLDQRQKNQGSMEKNC